MKLEEKIRLFGHFLFCEVKAGTTVITMQSIDGLTGCVSDGKVQLPIEDCRLILKELKSIQKEDAFKCAELANLPCSLYNNWKIMTNNFGQTIFSFPDENINYRNMVIFTEDKLNFRQCDYLRNQGYNIGVDPEMVILV